MRKRSKRIVAGLLIALAGFSAYGGYVGLLDSGAPRPDVGAGISPAAEIDLSAIPSSAAVSYANMAPGDQVSGSLTLHHPKLRERGLSMNTSAVSAGVNDLVGNLRLRVAERVGEGCDFPYHDRYGAKTLLRDDREYYEGPLIRAVLSTRAKGLSHAPADADRLELCLSVVLPLSADDRLQGSSTTATFHFLLEGPN